MADDPSKALVSDLMRQFEALKAGRVDFDRKWQLVSDYELARRDFSVTQRPNQLRPHRMTSSYATSRGRDLASLLLAYWFDPTRPFLIPSVKRGLVAAGRDPELDQAGLDYLGGLEWTVFDHLMLPKANLRQRAGAMLMEYVFFGCGVLFTGRRRGFGPYFANRPLNACWWAENVDGDVDTLFYRMMLPLYRVIQRWPAAAAVDGWKDKAGTPDELNYVSIVLACRPRLGGQKGAVKEAKPFAFYAFSDEKSALLEESGYDSFPYSVFRANPMPGQTYAEGMGVQALPDVMLLNHMQQNIEDIADQKARPPLAWPARMFGKPLDRRPGAPNAYNPAGLGLTRPDQAILKLDFTGELQDPVQIIEMLKGSIDDCFYRDLVQLREAGDMTAEEVNARTDIRLRGTSTILANMEKPTTELGDRAMEIMVEEMQIMPGPPSVAGANVDWEYAGPLAIAQLKGQVRGALEMINARGLVFQQDQAAANAVDLEECLRVINEGGGAPTRLMNSRAKVAAGRAEMAHQAQQAADAAKLQQVAVAAKDGGAGIASLAQAANAGQPAGGGGAAFQPVGAFAPGQVAA